MDGDLRATAPEDPEKRLRLLRRWCPRWSIEADDEEIDEILRWAFSQEEIE